MFCRSIALVLALSGCAAHTQVSSSSAVQSAEQFQLVDNARQRTVPVILYGARASGNQKPLAVLSHGYGGLNSDYTFIASELVRRGYLVASIQHSELPGDPPLARAGNLAELRRPVWQIGADSIGFVIREMRERGFADDSNVLLLGHSNGGDMSMLFATQRPDEVRAVFSLDHRRMPVPRTASPRICSARSNDFDADPGVFPTASGRLDLEMVIADVPVSHNDMWDGASDEQKSRMLEVLSDCLNRL